MSSAASTKEIGGILGLSAETLSMVNEEMDIGAMLKISKEFAMNSEKVDMKSEMMSDAMDMASDSKLDEDAD